MLINSGMEDKIMGLFGFGKKKEVAPEFLATQNGEVINIEEVGDGVFSAKMIGDGFAVTPSSNEVYAPVSGKVTQVFDTYHAYGITTDDGLDVLVHIGLDTVSLNGEGFKPFVKEGQKVKAGDKIAEADLDFIKSKGYKTTTIVIITNMDAVSGLNVNYGTSKGGETVAMTYTK